MESTLALAINHENKVDRNIQDARNASEIRQRQRAHWTSREQSRQRSARELKESHDSLSTAATWVRIHRHSLRRSSVLSPKEIA